MIGRKIQFIIKGKAESITEGIVRDKIFCPNKSNSFVITAYLVEVDYSAYIVLPDSIVVIHPE